MVHKRVTTYRRPRHKMPAGTKSVHFKGFMTESEPRVPKYQHRQPVRPEKADEMYPEKWPNYTHNDVETRITNVLEPLSLFAPYPHEDHREPPVADDRSHKSLELERPVTPIDEEVKTQPRDFDRLANYVRRRIAAKPDVPYLSMDDQRNLAGILIGEVTLIWPEIMKQIDDPFLSPLENKELNRRIAVHIVTVCEKLFNHYLKKAQVLNERGIFSGPANMSRLKAQLALDANKFLNILTIRRYIVADIRGKEDSDGDDTDTFTAKFSGKQEISHPPLSFQGMIQSSRPKSKTKKYRYKTAEQEAKEISAAMPALDTNKLMGLVADMPDRDLQTPSQESDGFMSRAAGKQHMTSELSLEARSVQKILLKRSRSMPQLQIGEDILEELGIDAKSVRRDELEEVEIAMLKRNNEALDRKAKHPLEEKGPQPGTREYAQNDLKQLMSRPQDRHVGKIDEDLPPLLQALTRSAKHDGTKEKVLQKIKELEEKEKREIEKENIPLREPTHPQPATVSAKLPGMTVRASDIRVSERVCMSSITIDRFSTVFNDLMDEIDPVTVKNLDKNLFLGEEITEVYKEIMKTVPSTHLRLDDDVFVVPAADSVNLSGTMASASLNKRKAERVINPKMRSEKQPPWGADDPKTWVKTPNNPPKNFLGEDIFQPTTPNMERVHDAMHNPGKMSQMLQGDNMPKFVAEKMARTYASWLQWWKSTVTSDDYMKYLSTTENDYLGATFHFYDSDDDDDDYEESAGPQISMYTQSVGPSSHMPHVGAPKIPKPHSSKVSEIREREKKLNDLKEVKNKYEEGMWNCNTILMGGLGKDPGMVEDDDDASSKRQKSADTTKSAKTLHERAAARHSARQQEKTSTREFIQSRQSRQSKVTSVTGTMSKMDTDRSEESAPVEVPLTPQDRLEKVWKSLEMPDSHRLDMAIKYSCNEFYSRLFEVIDRWEKVTEFILKREDLLAKLEKFERNASDPNRFFEKGNKGSSVKRLQEAKQRSFYYKRIDYYDREIKIEIDYMMQQFQDIITYKGRSYEEKMKWDRIEMLYWLQEERKQNALKYEAMMKQSVPMKIKSAHLDPITPPSTAKVK
ncbi:coiled-coil domain-containing protein 87-like isoform X5 [Mizuhopecten yessoensis]|uniref:Monocarboxylate transporter 4 n=1 Tax=Mizuhopecten yessoensis TaxID=6573 RepID=A0A210Q2X8_MIZYE|nr:coiled-coil domain-containing protein 87-like isoform X5 [Mizuhopecten yessoensis]OWF43108.1 Monocarboxylate transporter 4 [Mizuhopecten yessoensis]